MPPVRIRDGRRGARDRKRETERWRTEPKDGKQKTGVGRSKMRDRKKTENERPETGDGKR